MSSKKLFLASSFADVVDLFSQFEPNSQGKTVTFIPTASFVESIVFYVNTGKKALESLGLSIEILDIATASYEEIRSKILNNDYIYVTGGNTFYLLQEMKKSGADQLISSAVESGKLYIGESAGAIITAPHIDYVASMDDASKAPDLKDFKGLDLMPCFTLPHHQEFPFVEITETIMSQYSAHLNLMPINNHQALILVDDDVKVENFL